jgi:hypothetical protein
MQIAYSPEKLRRLKDRLRAIDEAIAAIERLAAAAEPRRRCRGGRRGKGGFARKSELAGGSPLSA